MPPYALFGFLLFAAIGALNAHSIERAEHTDKCPSDEWIRRIQQGCTQENELLLEAEDKHDHAGVCSGYVAMLNCVAKNAIDCFERYEESSNYFGHSPYNCVLTAEEVKHLQFLYRESKGTSEPASGDTTPDSAPQPWTNGQGGGASNKTAESETNKDDVSIKYSETENKGSEDPDIATETEKNNKGKQAEHKGSDGDKDNGHPQTSWSLWIILAVAITSGRLPWRLMS